MIHQCKGLHEYYSMETQIFDFLKFKIEFWRVLTSWNHLSFVNISPTLVIDTSMERSSRVLQHVHGKCEFYKIKVAKAQKISSVINGIFRGYISPIYNLGKCRLTDEIFRASSVLQVLVVHHGSNISTCSRLISFTRLVIIPWCHGKNFRLSYFVNNFCLCYAQWLVLSFYP